MGKSDPLLLLDNGTLAYILGNGEYRFTNPELERVMYSYLGLSCREFPYEPEERLNIGQDAIAFKLYFTPSGTQPIVLGDDGQEAVKIKNLYIYCQHIVRVK